MSDIVTKIDFQVDQHEGIGEMLLFMEDSRVITVACRPQAWVQRHERSPHEMIVGALVSPLVREFDAQAAEIERLRLRIEQLEADLDGFVHGSL